MLHASSYLVPSSYYGRAWHLLSVQKAFSKMCEHILAYGGCNSIASQRCIRVRRLAQILLEKTLNPNPDISWRGSAPIGVASSLRIL